jgi:hypothetical protein
MVGADRRCIEDLIARQICPFPGALADCVSNQSNGVADLHLSDNDARSTAGRLHVFIDVLCKDVERHISAEQ